MPNGGSKRDQIVFKLLGTILCVIMFGIQISSQAEDLLAKAFNPAVMTQRRFKPGDRVRIRGTQRAMRVLRYHVEYDPQSGYIMNPNRVECGYYAHGHYHQQLLEESLLEPMGSYLPKHPGLSGIDWRHGHGHPGNQGTD